MRRCTPRRRLPCLHRTGGDAAGAAYPGPFSGRFAMTNTTKFVTIATMLLAWTGLSHGQEAGRVQFRLGLQPGQSFRSEIVTHWLSRPTGLSGGEETWGVTYKFDVQSVADDGTAAINVSYDAVRWISGANQIDFDSKNPPETPPTSIAKGVADMVGRSFTIEMNPQGRITKVDGLEGVLDRVTSWFEGDEVLRAFLTGYFRKQIGKDATVGTIHAMMVGYPKRSVGVGSRWTANNSATVALSIPVEMQNAYTVKSRANGLATLDVQTKIKSDGNVDPVSMGPVTNIYNITGERKGEIVFHETAGWPVSAKMTIEFEGTMTVVGIPGEDVGRRIPVSCTGETTVKTTK